MTRKRKNKPSAPRKVVAEAAANDEARLVNVQLRESRAEAARLKAQGGEVNIDKTTGLIKGAWRRDVFTILRAKRGKPSDGYPKGRPALEAIGYDAFRAHERDLHLAEGAVNPERQPEYIRASVEGAPGQAVTAETLDAAERLRETNKRLSPPDRSLLAALFDGDAALARNWRGVVEKRTGERQDEAQAARVRALGDNLHWARTVAMAAIKKARAANDDQAPPREAHPADPAVTWFRGSEFG